VHVPFFARGTGRLSLASAAELVDCPNRRRHSKRRAGTVNSSAGTISAAPAGYANHSKHSGSACQELTLLALPVRSTCSTTWLRRGSATRPRWQDF